MSGMSLSIFEIEGYGASAVRGLVCGSEPKEEPFVSPKCPVRMLGNAPGDEIREQGPNGESIC